ncbi:MAG TPA: ATP-dependent metallopeptidase FtsH/Yme1/Tma family protein [Candidatus Acidoferrum sp.]|nr:ATP-dependent metallopeptidase FtsH/Yme1/Tma family protein [Candidatus Acidoferrum sp.]
MTKTIRGIVFWLFIAISAALLWQVVRATPEQRSSPEISYSQLISEAESGKVASVRISGSRIQGQYRDGSSFRLTGPTDPGDMLRVLHDKNVEIWFREAATPDLPKQLLGTWSPLILLAALWFYMIRQMRGRAGSTQIGPGIMPPGGPV